MPALARRRAPTQVHSASANNPFNQFPKLERVETRTPPKKDQLARLRKLREMLKSGQLSPQTIHSMMEFHSNLSIFEAVALAEREGKLLIPNIVHDRVQNQTCAEYLSWAGTLIVHEDLAQPFGDSVIFHWTDEVSSHYSLSFQIPEEYVGKVGCALAIEHPDFTFVKTGENSYEVNLTKDAVIHLVEDFPVKDGWYKQNELGIPYGSPEAESRHGRQLSRTNLGYIGLLVRGDFNFYAWRKFVVAFYWASDRLGVAFVS